MASDTDKKYRLARLVDEGTTVIIVAVLLTHLLTLVIVGKYSVDILEKKKEMAPPTATVGAVCPMDAAISGTDPVTVPAPLELPPAPPHDPLDEATARAALADVLGFGTADLPSWLADITDMEVVDGVLKVRTCATPTPEGGYSLLVSERGRTLARGLVDALALSYNRNLRQAIYFVEVYGAGDTPPVAAVGARGFEQHPDNQGHIYR